MRVRDLGVPARKSSVHRGAGVVPLQDWGEHLASAPQQTECRGGAGGERGLALWLRKASSGCDGVGEHSR